MHYSPVCDRSTVAYLAYLAVVSCNGSSAKRVAAVSWRGGVDKNISGGDHHGGNVVDVFDKFLDEARRESVEVDASVADHRVSDYIGSNIGIGGWKSAKRLAGVANRDDGRSDSSLDGAVRVGCDGRGNVGSGTNGSSGKSVQSGFPVAEVPLGDSDVSARTLVNREKRRKSKERRQRKREGSSGAKQAKSVVGERGASSLLERSVEEKWIAKNKLEQKKAERELKLLESSSVGDEARRRAVRAKADTERAMVAIERSHLKLVKADCVPGERSPVGGEPLLSDDGVLLGTVETVVTGCSISPESSASMADFRRCQKELLDANKRNEDLLAKNAEFIAKLEKIGVPVDQVDHLAKSEWTCDVVGGPTAENALILEEIHPHGWTISPEDTTLHLDGKLTARVFGY